MQAIERRKPIKQVEARQNRFGLRRRLRCPKILFIVAGAIAFGGLAPASAEEAPPASVKESVLDFTARGIDGSEVALSRYRGEVVLIVNTASKCGFTYQYEGLERLYRRYGGDGFVVLGFPSDNFLNQEFETADEIAAFCDNEFGITFPLFDKVDVTGPTQHPVFAFLTQPETAGSFAGRVTWNFNKFLVGRDGELIARFDTRTEPEDPAVITAIETALAASSR